MARRLPLLLLLAAGLALPVAAAETLGEASGNCLACHVTPGGEFRYPTVTWEQYSVLRFLVLAPAVAVALYGFIRYAERWLHGGQRISIDNPAERLRRLVKYGLLQAKVVRQWPGVAVHLPIYIGSLLLLAAGLVYLYDPAGTRYPGGGVYTVFRVLLNTGNLLLLAGIVVAAARRLAGLTPALVNGPEDYLVLALLAALAATGMVLDAGTALAHNPGGPAWWDLSAQLLAPLLRGMDVASFLWMYRATLVVHLVIVALLVISLAATKLSHIVVSGVANTFFSRLGHPAALPLVEDAEKKIEEGEAIGVVRLRDTTWKQRMDYDSCVGCARCHNACPAAAAGRPLSPMRLVRSLRDAVRSGRWDEEVVPAIIEPDVVWSCVTCGACVAECPVLVHHVETIVELRRGLVSRGEHVPDELLQVSYNLMKTGNPYGSDPYEKEQWLQGLAEKGLVEIAEPGVEYDYILWVGCAPAYDPRLRGTVEAVLRLAKRAGLRVAVIPEQGCCGDPARRIGDELMFQELARQNIEMLKQYRFRRLLVTCPHGYNVFRNEYPQLGLEVEVEHHSQLLARLLREGKLKPTRRLDAVATFHDPCYLGRWNGEYEAPRAVVRAAVRELREMPRSREKSFCCGGGGGGAFFDFKKGARISRLRAQEAADTGAKVLAVACPFCNIMLSAEAPDFNMEVKDVAELLDEATGGKENEEG